MNYNHLHYFYIVVREGSISAASRHLHMSQPSLSSQIKNFEESMGVSLFDRRGNKLRLTPSGKSVYVHAARMFEISALISEEVTKSSKHEPPIKLGISDDIERPFAVSLVKSLFTKWKRKDPPAISFVTGLSEDLLGKLRGWSIDAVITNRPSSYEDLEVVGTLVMPVVLAAASEVSGAKLSGIYCSDKDIQKVIPKMKKGLSVPSSRLKLREEINAFSVRENLSARVTFESDTLAMVIRAIIDNVGVGFIPLPYISREVMKKEIVVFGNSDGLWQHSLFLMIKRGRTNSPGVVEVREAFSDLCKELSKNLKDVEFSKTLGPFLKS